MWPSFPPLSKKKSLHERRDLAVKLLASGHSIRLTASGAELSPTTVLRLKRRMEESHRGALAPVQIGRPIGSGRKLSMSDESRVLECMLSGPPSFRQRGFELWTRERLRRRIQSDLGIELNKDTVGLYLSRWALLWEMDFPQTTHYWRVNTNEPTRTTIGRLLRSCSQKGAQLHVLEVRRFCPESSGIEGQDQSYDASIPALTASCFPEARILLNSIDLNRQNRWCAYSDQPAVNVIGDFVRRLAEDRPRVPFVIVNVKKDPIANELRQWASANMEEARVYIPDVTTALRANHDEVASEAEKYQGLRWWLEAIRRYDAGDYILV